MMRIINITVILFIQLISLCAALPSLLNLPRSDYDEIRAKKFVHYAGAAYCTESLIYNWSCPMCGEVELEDVRFLYNETTGDALTDRVTMTVFSCILFSEGQGFVGKMKSENAIVVAFRGSETAENWIDDVKVR